MMKQINIHFKWLLTKRNLFTFFVFTIIIICSLTIIAKNSNELNYFYSSSIIIKILIILTTIIYASNSFTRENNNYYVLLIPLIKSRNEYIIPKLGSYFISLIVFILVITILFIFIGYINISTFRLRKDLFYYVVIILFLCVIFSLYTILLTQFSNTNLSVIIPITLFISIEYLLEIFGKSKMQFLLFFFPTITIENNQLILPLSDSINSQLSNIFSFLQLVLLTIILVIVNLIVYNKREMY